MSWVHRTMIVAAADAPLARALAAGIGVSGTGANMFTTGLSATGAAPATHYISAGLIWPEFAALFGDADATYAAAQAAGAQVTLAAIQGMYQRATIRADQNPHAVIAELGLKLIQEE